jgi:hypothetical protein
MNEQYEPVPEPVITREQEEALWDFHMTEGDDDAYVFTRRECVKMAKGMPHVRQSLIREMLARMRSNPGVIQYAAHELRELASQLDSEAEALRQRGAVCPP